jgi:hypothetical protein
LSSDDSGDLGLSRFFEKGGWHAASFHLFLTAIPTSVDETLKPSVSPLMFTASGYQVGISVELKTGPFVMPRRRMSFARGSKRSVKDVAIERL